MSSKTELRPQPESVFEKRWIGMAEGIEIRLDKRPEIGDVITTIRGKFVVTTIFVTRRVVLFAHDGDGVAP